MQFNHGPNKQANEVTLSLKSDSANFFHPTIKINNNSIAECPNPKNLVIMLGSILNSVFILIKKLKNVTN